MGMHWDNGIGSRGRRPWLLLVRGDEVRAFAGEGINGWVSVLGTDYKKNGKWSSTTYRIELAEGVAAISGREGWEKGTFAEGLAAADGRGGRDCSPPVERIDRWSELAVALRVTVSSAMTFLRAWRPKAACALDEVDEQLEALEIETDCGVHELSISFGGPTRRMREAGFWDWPVIVLDDAEREVGRLTVDADGRYVATGSLRILEQSRASGHGGGYQSIRLAAPEGSTWTHNEPR